jgi:hypothetical protein
MTAFLNHHGVAVLLALSACAADPFTQGTTPHDFGKTLTELKIPYNGAFTSVLTTDLDAVWNGDFLYVGLLRWPVYAWPKDRDYVSGDDLIDLGGSQVFRVDMKTLAMTDTGAVKDLSIEEHSHGMMSGDGCVFRRPADIQLYAGGTWRQIPYPPDAATSDQLLGRADGRLAVADAAGVYVFDGAAWHTLFFTELSTAGHAANREDVSLGTWDDDGLRVVRFLRATSTLTAERYDTTSFTLKDRATPQVITPAVPDGTMTGARNGTPMEFTVGLFGATAEDTELYHFANDAFVHSGTMQGHRLVNSPGSQTLLGGRAEGLGTRDRMNTIADVVELHAGGFVAVTNGVPGEAQLEAQDGALVCNFVENNGPYDLPIGFKGATCASSIGLAPSPGADKVAVVSVQSRINLPTARLSLRVLTLPHAGGLFTPQ